MYIVYRKSTQACCFWIGWVPLSATFPKDMKTLINQKVATAHCSPFPSGAGAVEPYHARSPWIGFTSSTAQGGGGSFKNRKPIGEIGCCESGMAERIHWWTERCLRSPLFLSLSLTIYLPTSLSSMYLSIYRSIYLSLSLFHLITYLPIYLSTYLPIYLCTYLPIYLSIYLYIYLSLSLSSVYLSSCLPVCLSICLSVYLSICGAVSFSVM